MKLHYLKNCGDAVNNVITVSENTTLVLSKDCEIIPNSCGITKGFKTALIKYQVWKNNMPVLRGEMDGCEAATKSNAEMKTLLKILGLPGSCPVESVSFVL